MAKNWTEDISSWLQPWFQRRSFSFFAPFPILIIIKEVIMVIPVIFLCQHSQLCCTDHRHHWLDQGLEITITFLIFYKIYTKNKNSYYMISYIRQQKYDEIFRKEEINTKEKNCYFSPKVKVTI